MDRHPITDLTSCPLHTSTFQPPNYFTTTLTLDELLPLFQTAGLIIPPSHTPAALQTCSNFAFAKCTQEEFLNIMKEYCVVHRTVGALAGGAAAVGASALPTAGAAFGLVLALVKVSTAIKDRGKAAREKVRVEELRGRYLRGLATAEGLGIEVVGIAVVMAEIVARGFDDAETMGLGASSGATIQLLREDLLPYLRSLGGRDPRDVGLVELRGKRWELKQRLIRQYEIVGLHCARVEQGLAELKGGNGMYYVRVNRLVAYARECVLEIHLRAWYAMMGYFDPENSMVEIEDRGVSVAAAEKVARIQGFWEEYAEGRLGLLGMKYGSKKGVSGGRGPTTATNHEHAVLISDCGAEGDCLVARLSVTSLMAQAGVVCDEPEGGGIEYLADGSCEIWNDTMWSGKDRCSAMGRYVSHTIRQYVDDQLKIDGPVWQSSLGFVDRMRRAVPPPLPQRPTVRGSLTAPARLSTLQGTASLPNRIPFRLGADEVPTSSNLSQFQTSSPAWRDND